MRAVVDSKNQVLVLLYENNALAAIELVSKLKINKWNINNFLSIGADANSPIFIEYLVKKRGANVNFKDHMDENSIFRAAKNNSKKSFNLLLGYGADYKQANKKGYNCLMGMVKSPSIVKKIIKDFDIHHLSKDGQTALTLALQAENSESIKLIINESHSIEDISIFKRQIKKFRNSNNKNICDNAIKEITAIELNFKLQEDLVQKPTSKKMKI